MLFIRTNGDVEQAIAAFKSVVATLERGTFVTVLHDPDYPWLAIKERLDLSGDQRMVFYDGMAAAGLTELIEFTWDDQWSWTTYRHLSPGKPPRRFVLNPEPEEGQSPWIMNLGFREPWEAYADAPGDDDLQAMARYHQLPGITATGKLRFSDSWSFQTDLMVPGTGPGKDAGGSTNDLASLLLRSADGEILPISGSLRLMNAGLCFDGSTFLSKSMKTHHVYVPKLSLGGSCDVLRNSKGDRLVPVLTSLDQIPGVSPEKLQDEFSSIFVIDLIKELKNEGLIFDPLQNHGSLEIPPEDIPSFCKLMEFDDNDGQ